MDQQPKLFGGSLDEYVEVIQVVIILLMLSNAFKFCPARKCFVIFKLHVLVMLLIIYFSPPNSASVMSVNESKTSHSSLGDSISLTKMLISSHRNS